MKKSIKIIIGLFISVLVLSVVNFFTGNPYSKYKATQLVEKELQDLYPEGDYSLTYTRYDAYNGAYRFEYETEKMPWRYEIAVDAALVPHRIILWQLKSQFIDITATKRFGEQSDRHVQDVFKETFPEIYATYSIRIPSTFPTPDNWSTDFKLDVMPHLSMEYEYLGETKEDFLEKAKEIQAMLKEEKIGYHFARLELIDFIKENGVKVGRERVYFVNFKENDLIQLEDIQVL